jgi:lipoate-protein ligase A
MVVRTPGGPTLVLGSTQPPSVVAAGLGERGEIGVQRRRSGGGAVFVDRLDPIWVDLWVPSDDELFEPDVGRAPHWVGDSWASALGELGIGGLEVHRGPMRTTRWSELVCFAGVGPGEVLAGTRKVVGVAQWRSRQGSLFHSAAYRTWSPERWVGMLSAAAGPDGGSLTADVRSTAVGLDELVGPPVQPAQVVGALRRHLPGGAPWAEPALPT